MKDNIITIDNQLGESINVEVLDIFSVDDFPDKEYIVYKNLSLFTKDEEEIFVSILVEKDDEYSLLSIDDEEEWEYIKNIVNNALNDLGVGL